MVGEKASKLIGKVKNVDPIEAGVSAGVIAVLLFIGLYFLAGVLTLVAGLGTLGNLAWFGAFEGFLFAEVFLAEWYATFSYYFFISAIVMTVVITLARTPIATVIVVPFVALVYFAVTGGVEIIESVVSTEGLGEFAMPFLKGVMYSSVGASAIKGLGGEEEE